MAGYIGTKASVVTPGAERKKVFSITTTTTSLTGLVYTPGFVHVFHNGVRLVDGTDYTATNGTSITLTTAAQNGDEVVVISYATFQTSDTVSASAGGTFNNDVAINGDLTVDTNTLFVDAANNRVGVGTASPVARLQVISSTSGGISIAQGTENFYGASAHRFFTDGYAAETARIDSSGHLIVPAGVTLGTSAGVYNAANTLDDYEEGTWTPVLYGTTVAGTWTPDGAAGGGYVKVGNQVTCWFNANGTLSGASGDMQVSGLPFTNAPNNVAVRNNAVFSTGALQYWAGVNLMVMGPLTVPGTTIIYFHTYSAAGSGSSSGAMPPVVNGGHNLHAFVTYMVS